MNKRFEQIIASVTDYKECQYRSGGGECKATSVSKCRKGCKFKSPHLTLSNYQEKAVEAFDVMQEQFANLHSKYVSLKKECENTKLQYEALKNDCKRMTDDCASMSKEVEELINLLAEAGLIEEGEEDGNE